MAGFCKVTAIGNLGKDPEIRYTQAGNPVASFSLACSESWKNKDGEKQERTEWLNVSVFGPVAKVVQEYCSKGKQVYIEGTLRTEEWEDKEGNKRRTTKVVLSGPNTKLVLLGGGNGGARREEPANGTDGWDDDGDVPF
jgi:single-strand DNA-binding protein